MGRREAKNLAAAKKPLKRSRSAEAWDQAAAMKITTWNVNSLNVRLAYVLAWMEFARPDVLCLQETKLSQEAFPSAEFAALGYESKHYGQGRWNGVAIVSKVGLENPAQGFTSDTYELCQEADDEARIVWATCGGARVASAYIPNGRAIDDPHYSYKLRWLQRLKAQLENHHTAGENIAIVGDFNIAPADNDVWSMDAFEGKTHVTAPERQNWMALCDWGLEDVFRQRFAGIDGLYTYWDYQAGRFHKREGMRIDHILASKPLADKLAWISLDRNARKVRDENKPSDHAPLTAEFVL